MKGRIFYSPIAAETANGKVFRIKGKGNATYKPSWSVWRFVYQN
jgi:hypothetical protein